MRSDSALELLHSYISDSKPNKGAKRLIDIVTERSKHAMSGTDHLCDLLDRKIADIALM